jgi:RNA polymerase sigma factor (sigma-70 family)
MNPRNHEESIEHIFDSYCKRCLKREAINIHKHLKWRGGREIAFSAMSVTELASLAVEDKYFVDEYVFSVHGESVGVTDSDLAEALTALPADRREIVLMSYFFDMPDKEIAQRLNMARRTVAYKRTSTLKELKKIMEESED